MHRNSTACSLTDGICFVKKQRKSRNFFQISTPLHKQEISFYNSPYRSFTRNSTHNVLSKLYETPPEGLYQHNILLIEIPSFSFAVNALLVPKVN